MNTQLLNVSTRSEAQALAPLALVILQIAGGYIALSVVHS